MNKKFIPYQDFLLDKLQDQENAIAYLNAALMDEDPRIFLIALKNIFDAQNIKIKAGAQSGSRKQEGVDKILSKKGDPTLPSMNEMLNRIGLNLAVQPLKK